MLKKVLLSITIALIVLVGIVLYRTITFKSKQLKVAAIERIAIDSNSIDRFSQAIKIPTISYDDSTQFDSTSFQGFLDLLSRNYPLTDSLLQREVINGYSLLYTWKGTATTAKPILLLAHMDVVPLEAETAAKWTQPAFSGAVKDGYIWGRGSLDDKLSVIALLEATELLLKQGYQPKRTIYLAFGHDEEVSGKKGAAQIASILQQRGIKAEFALDEGLVITDGIVPGVEPPVGLIGLAEKGFLTVELKTAIDGGHSSMPERATNIGVLAAAVAKLEQHPLPVKISGATQQFINYIGPEMPFVERMAFANMWLFKGLFVSALEKSAAGSASIRTTTAPTVFRSGLKENLLPSEASALVNFRIIPGETPETVLDYVKKTIDDPRVQVHIANWAEKPSPVSSVDSEGYKSIEKTIRQLWPETIVTPSLVVGATDSRHYVEVADNIYRFQPIKLKQEDMARLHGINERISVADYKEAINFYYQLIKNTNL
ncbi:MAG: M20 family peptidase [Chitinophagales bacterium]|nr:M20 family peptidase [Chitinophagales bacterium]